MLQDINNLLSGAEEYIVKKVSDLLRTSQFQTNKAIRDAQPAPVNNTFAIASLAVSSATFVLLIALFIWLVWRLRNMTTVPMYAAGV